MFDGIAVRVHVFDKPKEVSAGAGYGKSFVFFASAEVDAIEYLLS
jgi:hypothetical protein